MTTGFDIINAVWAHDPDHKERYHVLADHHRATDEWTDHFLEPGYRLLPTSWADAPHLDVYWAPLGYTAPERRNKTAAGFAVLFADIDDGRVVKIGGELPSYLWRTSPGMYQAVWLLDDAPIEYSTWADLNQRMTYFLNADKGGWMGSKVLRVPGSLNVKRSGEGVQVWGETINTSGALFSTAMLDKLLPPVAKQRPATSDNVPSTWTTAEARRQAKALPLSLRALLYNRRVGDRSLHIVKTANEFIRRGISPEDTFRFIEERPWNKFANRPETLWEQVQTATGTADN